MKKTYFLIILSALYYSVSAQLNVQSLVATSGDYFINSSFSLSWSLGEIATETLTSSEIIVTQGFQQSKLEPIAINEPKALESPYVVFPNPAQNQIIIQWNTTENPNGIPNQAFIYDLQGRKVIVKELVENPQTIDISKLNGAVYYLQLINYASNFNQTIVIQKLNP